MAADCVFILSKSLAIIHRHYYGARISPHNHWEYISRAFLIIFEDMFIKRQNIGFDYMKNICVVDYRRSCPHGRNSAGNLELKKAILPDLRRTYVYTARPGASD
jgi:hypothetical protein